ncbi:hypothetical protein CSUI_006714 [Cystoisospora suis]|uniref:Uncharacterized protein n=1 Tax=Cystoisospora suis TaxID=483139 RepID=A0A2C6KT20_9APIC|nr:hypothetical protein CSUI_006714 [Cystoisospora suis]
MDSSILPVPISPRGRTSSVSDVSSSPPLPPSSSSLQPPPLPSDNLSVSIPLPTTTSGYLPLPDLLPKRPVLRPGEIYSVHALRERGIDFAVRPEGGYHGGDRKAKWRQNRLRFLDPGYVPLKEDVLRVHQELWKEKDEEDHIKSARRRLPGEKRLLFAGLDPDPLSPPHSSFISSVHPQQEGDLFHRKKLLLRSGDFFSPFHSERSLNAVWGSREEDADGEGGGEEEAEGEAHQGGGGAHHEEDFDPVTGCTPHGKRDRYEGYCDLRYIPCIGKDYRNVAHSPHDLQDERYTHLAAHKKKKNAPGGGLFTGGSPCFLPPLMRPLRDTALHPLPGQPSKPAWKDLIEKEKGCLGPRERNYHLYALDKDKHTSSSYIRRRMKEEEEEEHHQAHERRKKGAAWGDTNVVDSSKTTISTTSTLILNTRTHRLERRTVRGVPRGRSMVRQREEDDPSKKCMSLSKRRGPYEGRTGADDARGDEDEEEDGMMTYKEFMQSSCSSSITTEKGVKRIALLFEAFERSHPDPSGWLRTREFRWNLERDFRIQDIFGLRRKLNSSSSHSTSSKARNASEVRGDRSHVLYASSPRGMMWKAKKKGLTEEKDLQGRRERGGGTCGGMEETSSSTLLEGIFSWVSQALRNRDEPVLLTKKSQVKFEAILDQIRRVESELIANERETGEPKLSFDVFCRALWSFATPSENPASWSRGLGGSELLVSAQKQEAYALTATQMLVRDAILGVNIAESELKLPDYVGLGNLALMETPELSLAREANDRRLLEEKRRRQENMRYKEVLSPFEESFSRAVQLERDLAEHQVLKQRLDRLSRERFLSTPSKALYHFVENMRSKPSRGGGGFEEAFEREEDLYKAVPRFQLPPEEVQRREARRLRILKETRQRRRKHKKEEGEGGDESSSSIEKGDDSDDEDGETDKKKNRRRDGDEEDGEGDTYDTYSSSSHERELYYPPTELISDIYEEDDDDDADEDQLEGWGRKLPRNYYSSSSLLLEQRVVKSGGERKEKKESKKSGSLLAEKEHHKRDMKDDRERKKIGKTSMLLLGNQIDELDDYVPDLAGRHVSPGEQEGKHDRNNKKKDLVSRFLSEEDTSGKGGEEDEEEDQDDVVSLAPLSDQ